MRPVAAANSRQPLDKAMSAAKLVVPGSRRAVRVPQAGQRIRRAARMALSWLGWRASSVPQSPQPVTDTGAVQPKPLSRWRTIRPLTAAHPLGRHSGGPVA
jgi:hypothetical protein